MNVELAVSEIKRAERMLAHEIDIAYPVGARFKIKWLHDSTPEVEVVSSMSRVGALRCRLLEDVPNRIAGKPSIRKMGAEETVSVEWIIK